MISMDKEYVTSDGQEVRVLCTDRDVGNPVVALIGPDALVFSLTSEGRLSEFEKHDVDLVEKPKIRKGWVNVYKLDEFSTHNERASTIWETKTLADAASCEDRIACIEVEFKEGEGI